MGKISNLALKRRGIVPPLVLSPDILADKELPGVELQEPVAPVAADTITASFPK
jgi:hypothetical protein